MTRLARTFLITATWLLLAAIPPAVAGPPPRGERWVAADQPVTECSTLRPQANAEVEGLLSTFYEDGVYRHAVTHIDLRRLPAGFFTEPSAYLIFRVWKERDGSARIVRDLPARLFLYDKRAGAVLRSAPIDRISRNTIDAAMALSRRALPAEGYAQVLEEFSVLLSEIDESWEGVTIAGYAHGAGPAPTFAVDALLPPFAAEPALYAQLGTSPALQALHPFALMEHADAAGLCARFDREVQQVRSAYTELDRPYIRPLRD